MAVIIVLTVTAVHTAAISDLQGDTERSKIKSPGVNIGFSVWLQADSTYHETPTTVGATDDSGPDFGISPSSMTDRQFPVHDGKNRPQFLELVTAEISILEGLDDGTSMVFGEL